MPPSSVSRVETHRAPFNVVLITIGNYTPPDCEFNRVVLNFSAVSHGRQYDRLAIMYFGDTEVCKSLPGPWEPKYA